MTKAKNQQATAGTAPAIHVAGKAKFVTVASKLPMDLEIQLCKPTTANITGQFGSVKETVHVKTGQMYRIRGTAYPVNVAPKGFPRAPEMIEDENGGYALTKNIPADFWDEWVKQNAETEMVQNGIIKAQADLDDLAADAAEHAHRDSGLGPLNPDSDRRAPKPSNGQVSAVKAEPRASA